MRRKLINHDVFQQINESSLTKTEEELKKAEDVLSAALGTRGLKLHCFNDSAVAFETVDRSYIHAGYRVKGDNIIFENIEELVIDEDSARAGAKSILRKLVDNLLDDKVQNANDLFKEYISLPTIRRTLLEATGTKSSKKEAKKFNETLGHTSRFNSSPKFAKPNPRKLSEWKILSENISNYLKYQEFGPALHNSEIRRDEKGNVIFVRIPDSHSRNEGKILSFNWKTLNTDVQVLRGKMKGINEDANFCRAMMDLRKANAISDANATEEIIENIVAAWPNLIYLNHGELTQKIGEALEFAGNKNWDDELCAFLAEGILRKATEAYSERVEKIIRLSGMKLEHTSEDLYEHFQNIVSVFYPKLDETMQLEMQVFVDLYNALVEIHKIATTENNKVLKYESDEYLKDLYSVLNQESKPTLELAGEVSAWLTNLIETNLETAPWNVSNSVYITTNGDNPKLATWANHSYTPSKDFSGDWGDVAPVSDGKSYKGDLADQMRSNAWGNIGGGEVYPDLKNPYVPKAGHWTMQKGNDGADRSGDDSWSRWQSNDTWPGLQNPYVPKGVTPQTYKMNHGKEDDLVVDM